MFYDDTDYDDMNEITRTDIETSLDADWLAEQYRLATGLYFQIRTHISERKFAGLDDTEWFERAAGKCAFLKLGTKWIEARLIELGADVPYPPTDARNMTIRRLDAQVKALGGAVSPQGSETS